MRRPRGAGALRRLALTCGVAALLAVACAQPERGDHTGRAETLVTEQEAVAIALEAVAGKVAIQPSSVLHVDMRGDVAVVEWRTQLPPNTRGADYDARVTIDRRTREVLELLVGS